MEKKFKDSTIPELYSEQLALQCLSLNMSAVPKVATMLFDGTSHLLAAVKNTTTPQALVFRSASNNFIAAAVVEYEKNENENDVAAGHWEYYWTTNEDDIKDANKIEFSSNGNVLQYFYASAKNLYSMVFNDSSATCITLMTYMADIIVQNVKENTRDGEPYSLVLDGVFKATGQVEDGKVVVSIIPDHDMKVIIKDDSSIQN